MAKGGRTKIGQGVEVEVEGTKVTVTFDLGNDFGKSGSGKSTIVASTKGNIEIAPGVRMGLNVFK